MKNLDLNAFDVKEMSRTELTSIEGGRLFNAIAEWTTQAYQDSRDWVVGAGRWVGEAVSNGAR